jgi:hypothetical protein
MSQRVLTGAAAAAVSALALGAAPVVHHHAGPALSAAPGRVVAGTAVVLHGRGFPHDAHIVLRAGHPHAAAARIGEARTGRRGTFDASIRIDASASPGVYVALACHDRCHEKASVRFRVLRP